MAVDIKGVEPSQYKDVQSDHEKEENLYLVCTCPTVLLGQASAGVKYLLFTLTGKFTGLLIVKQGCVDIDHDEFATN